MTGFRETCRDATRVYSCTLYTNTGGKTSREPLLFFFSSRFFGRVRRPSCVGRRVYTCIYVRFPIRGGCGYVPPRTSAERPERTGPFSSDVIIIRLLPSPTKTHTRASARAARETRRVRATTIITWARRGDADAHRRRWQPLRACGRRVDDGNSSNVCYTWNQSL